MDNLNKSQNLDKKILIADDNLDILESMRVLLEMEGYDVMTTSRGKNVEGMLKHSPDLVFLDIWISGTDGREVCRDIKSKSATKDIPIIMISAGRNVAKSAIDSGADDFIAKPFEIDNVLNKVKKHLSSN